MEASSKENLVKLQWLTNKLNGKAYNYQTPTKEGKNYVVWFFADVENHLYIFEEDLSDEMTQGKTLTELTQESE